MKRILRLTIFFLLAAGAAAILLRLPAAGPATAAAVEEEEEEEAGPAAPSRVSVQNGETVVAVSPAEQKAYGIRTQPLETVARREEARANAVILPVQDLIELRTGYLAAKAEVAKTKAGFEAARAEHERIRALYEDDRNASLKMLQEAEATLSADRAAFQNAKRALSLGENLARQRWGAVIARALAAGSPAFERIVRQSDLLLRVTLPRERGFKPPGAASLQAPDGTLISTRFVSLYPQVDPRLQAPTALYRTAYRPDLAPGMSLVGLLPSGPKLSGIVIPENAVVWWEGRAWAYVQAAPGRFARREVPTGAPIEGGWFVRTGFAAGQSIVLQGAQQLLSEEFRSRIQVGD
jgi:hypothetical protein